MSHCNIILYGYAKKHTYSIIMQVYKLIATYYKTRLIILTTEENTINGYR